MKRLEFLNKAMIEMTKDEWESLCDGCGLCCQLRVEDIDTGELALTNAACSFLCLDSLQCTDYTNRQKNVPDCVKVTPENVNELNWLPQTCAYRLVASGTDLPDWHHLISGDKSQVHDVGPSMKGELVPEDDVVWD
jgi:uncharacterized cysteine cluster protein YcgN (CxxCxxCC family)